MRWANLVDTSFAHASSSVAGVTPNEVAWKRESHDPNFPTFFTNESTLLPSRLRIPKELRYGFLFESKAIIPKVYERVEKVITDFELFFTHNTKLLQRYENARWIPGGGVWVGGDYAGGTLGLNRKSRSVSILSSRKVQSRLHRTRLKTALLLEYRKKYDVDVFRQSLVGSPGRISVWETLRDYRYSICIENFVDDEYFTEKVLNPFACGTVPIYMGARNLNDYFDEKGFIRFTSIRQLANEVLPLLSEQDYQSRLSAVARNFETVKKYRSIEDFIFTTYYINRGGLS